MPDSGWPVTREDLDPYYARAHELLQLGPYEYEPSYWTQEYPKAEELDFGRGFRTKMWQFSPPTRFGTVYRSDILSARNLRLYTHATACALEASDNVSGIESISVRAPDGRRHSVRARQVVIACGAVQNARLLLASNRQAPAGIGNDNDLVGRYFMEHLEIPGANLLLRDSRALPMYVLPPVIAGEVRQPRGEIAMTEELQTELGVLNGTASIEPGRWGENVKSTFQRFTPEVLSEYRASRERGESQESSNPERATRSRRKYRLKTRQEQMPNPDSRILLDDKVDALDVPLVKIDWQLSELDKYSIRSFYHALGRRIGAAGLGRLQLADWLTDGDDSIWPEFLSGGWHHMGTTRMSDDPSRGVVDANCKVHGIENLYVAGSAAFVTGGAPNPTLTLTALTLRLSDHLKSRFS